MEKKSSNNSISNKNNKKSSLQFDRHNTQSSSIVSSFTGNGGAGITSLGTPANVNTTTQNENGTDSNDINETRHSLHQTAQHNIENIASLVVQALSNMVL